VVWHTPRHRRNRRFLSKLDRPQALRFPLRISIERQNCLSTSASGVMRFMTRLSTAARPGPPGWVRCPGKRTSNRIKANCSRAISKDSVKRTAPRPVFNPKPRDRKKQQGSAVMAERSGHESKETERTETLSPPLNSRRALCCGSSGQVVVAQERSARSRIGGWQLNTFRTITQPIDLGQASQHCHPLIRIRCFDQEQVSSTSVRPTDIDRTVQAAKHDHG